MAEGELVVAVGVAYPPEEIDRIEAVDPRVRVLPVPELYNVFRETIEGEQLERLWERLREAEVLIAIGAVTREHLATAARLRWVHVAGAGLEAFAASGGLEMGLAVTNSSGANAVPIAEWVAGATLFLTKGFQHAVRNQDEGRWARWSSESLDGRTAGIVGMGAIGRESARRLRAFGMRIIATRRSAKPGDVDPDCDLLLPDRELPTLLAESDVVVLGVPLTPATTKLIGAAELARMKPTAILVNIARGPVVDTAALLTALQERRIAGAALDVTDPEPLPPGHPLWALDNILITPHNSGTAEGLWRRTNAIFVRNLRHYLAGEPMENLVPPGRGY